MTSAGSQQGGLMIKGLMHCGTNFLQHVLKANFGDATRNVSAGSNYVHRGCSRNSTTPVADNCCSKHSLAIHDECIFAPPVSALVLILSSPYRWLSSMHYEYSWNRARDNVWRAKACDGGRYRANYSRRRGLPDCVTDGEHTPVRNLSTYIRAWHRGVEPGVRWTGSTDAAWCANRACDSLASYWSAAASAYRDARHPKALLLRYEDLFDASALERRLRGLEPLYTLSGPLVLPLVETKQINNKITGMFTRSTYTALAKTVAKRDWLRKFTSDDLAWVNTRLEAASMERFEYAFESR